MVETMGDGRCHSDGGFVAKNVFQAWIGNVVMSLHCGDP
jgi:hypothetical protein